MYFNWTSGDKNISNMTSHNHSVTLEQSNICLFIFFFAFFFFFFKDKDKVTVFF